MAIGAESPVAPEGRDAPKLKNVEGDLGLNSSAMSPIVVGQ